jgi:hypothetical protein
MHSIVYPVNGVHAEYVVETKGEGEKTKVVETIMFCQNSVSTTYTFVNGVLTVFLQGGRKEDTVESLSKRRNEANRQLNRARREAMAYAL